MTGPASADTVMASVLRPPAPRELQVEVTGACNLRCHMCLVRYRPALDKSVASMSLDTFRALVDSMTGLERITLQGLGEPLMAPDLLAMVRYASERGVAVGFNTNGTLLTRRKAAALVDAGLAWLHISVDGATPATYEAIRDRSSFARVERNARGLVDVMDRRGATSPKVGVVFVAQRSNYAELPDLVRLVHDWGIDDLRVQNLSHDFSDTDPAGDYREIRDYSLGQALWGAEKRRAEEVFARAAAVAGELGVRLRLPSLDDSAPDEPRALLPGGRRAGCDWPWRSAYVRFDGGVQPCCMVMGADRAILGDAGSESLADIWWSDAYATFRERLLSDEPPEVCRGCSEYRGLF